MSNYDIIIIGGGISGLFLTYTLSQTDLNILLLEQSSRLGGRINTRSDKGLTFESGAARFHSSHTKLISLIQQLGLDDTIFQLPDETNSILRNIDYRINNDKPYQTNRDLHLSHLFKESLDKKDTFTKDQLVSMSYFQYVTSIFDHETALFMKDSFGYDAEFIYLNADAALQMFESDFFEDNRYFVLHNGLSSIIQKMESRLSAKRNVTLLKSSPVEFIDSRRVSSKGRHFYYDQLICAIPPSSLQRFPIFKEVSGLLDSVKELPLLRVYAKYPLKRLWFKGIQRTMTDNPVRHVIPIDEKNGFIMICYCDSDLADMWNTSLSQGEDFVVQQIHKQLETIFSIDKIPDPEYVSFEYWPHGLHVWKQDYDMTELYDKIMKPLTDKNIYVCGEAFSKKQGWIEGCLQTCYDLLGKLDLQDYSIEMKSAELVTDESDNEEVVQDDKVGLTVDEIVKAKKYVIMEVGSEKKVFDVSEWMSRHPGGSSNIQRVIDATKNYYVNNVEPSPTQLFKQQATHKQGKEKTDSDSSAEILFTSLFVNHSNKHIKFVGNLKE